MRITDGRSSVGNELSVIQEVKQPEEYVRMAFYFLDGRAFRLKWLTGFWTIVPLVENGQEPIVGPGHLNPSICLKLTNSIMLSRSWERAKP